MNGDYATHIQKLQTELERHRGDMDRVESAISRQTESFREVGEKITSALNRHSDKIEMLVSQNINMVPKSVVENSIDKKTVGWMFAILASAIGAIRALDWILGKV